MVKVRDCDDGRAEEKARWCAAHLPALGARGYPVPAIVWHGMISAGWQVTVQSRLPGAIDAELARRGTGTAEPRGNTMNLTPDQLARINQLSDQWSFLWDKRRSLWIAAEDCPDGERIDETDLDVLLARLAAIVAVRG